MSSGFARRFVVEAAFLVLLALAAGFADLPTWQIAAVMAVGWLLVTLIEWLAWRSDRELEERLQTWTPMEDEEEPEARHGWDVEEILAPLPEERMGDEEFTSVLPPEEQET